MATIRGNGSKGHHYYEMDIWEVSGSGSSSTNKSAVTFNFKLGPIVNGYNWSSMRTMHYTITINGTNYTGDVPSTYNGRSVVTIVSDTTVEIEHNNDGTKNLDFSFSVVDNSSASYTTGNASASSSMWLETIPRYFSSTPTLSLKSKTETSITYNWSTSETCDSITWSGTGTKSTTGLPGTSGTVTFSGLTANTSYTHSGTFRRQDSGLSTPSSNYTNSTDNYPYVTTLNPQSITLGQTLTQIVNISNPHNRQTTVRVKFNDVNGTVIASATTSGASATITIPTNDLYQQIPSSPSGTLYYYCVYENHTTTGITGTYQINGNERPIFPTSNWSYVANLTQLTNDNQIVIDGYSDVTVTIDTPASSDYYATITGYYAKWGDVTNNNLTPSNPATLTGGTGTGITVLANDSRDLQSVLSTSTLDITNNRVLYTKPNVDTLETHRLNGVDTTVTLNATGTMFKDKFGEDGVQNAISSAVYYVKPVGSSTWSQAYGISLNDCYFDSTTGKWSIQNASIHQNGQSGGFPIGSSFNIKLALYDAQGLLGYGTLTSTIEDGSLGIDRYKDSNGNYHTGHNGLADDDYCDKFHGDIDVEGDIYVNGEKFEGGGGGGDTLPIGSIIDYDGDTVPDGYEEVDDYSTSEVFTGKLWIDGKKIYRKVYEVTKAQTSNNNPDIPTNVSNIDTIISEDGILVRSDNQFTKIPANFDNQSWWVYFSDISKTIIRVRIGQSLYDNAFVKLFVVIQYTKTTD